MEKYLIFATNGILSPLSIFDKFYNSMVIELSKEEAKQLVEKLNAEEGEGRYYTMSTNDYYSKLKTLKPKMEEFDKYCQIIGEELMNDPEIKGFVDKVYEEKDNNINGLDLPIKVDSSEEYFDKAREMLDDFARQIDKPAFDSQPGLKTEIYAICKNLKKALDFTKSGETEQLDIVLRKTLRDHFIWDNFIVSELDKSYAFRGIGPFEDLHTHGSEELYRKMNTHDIEFFRARVSDKPITELGEMAHLPYDKRSLSSNMRFSPQGQVCLYLGMTTYDCAKECRWNQKQDLYFSCFKPNEKGKKLRVLNLVIPYFLINGLGKNREYQNIVLKVFPLVIVTSFLIKNHGNTRPDYLISQRLINILQDFGIDGVAYLSCQGESGLQYPHGVNLAIPVNDINEKRQYGKICECFSMTIPLAVNKLGDDFSVGLKTTFINEIYPEKNKSRLNDTISCTSCNGKDVFYGDTLFSKWDNYLVNQEFKDFKE